MKLPSMGAGYFYKQTFCFLIFLSVIPFAQLNAETTSNIPQALKILQRKINNIKTFKDTFEILDEFMNLRPLNGKISNNAGKEKSILKKSRPVIVNTLAELCDEAIYDFRQSLKSEFIKIVGVPDGKMSHSQFVTLVNSKRFPIKKSADAYFSAHDKDRDNKLTIAEFVPSQIEIAKTSDAKSLSDSYINGEPYSTGQTPTETPPSKPIPPLYASIPLIEDRIRAFADSNNYTTGRLPDGKLGVIDADGNWVRIPSQVFPPQKQVAEDMLRDFAINIGASLVTNEGELPILKDKSGTIIPVNRWPPGTRPPYFPSGPPPEEPPR